MRLHSGDALRRALAVAGMAAATLLLVPPPAAHAHGVLEKSTPDAGARLSGPPKQFSLTFTEPPTGDAVVEVTDGCNRDVLGDVTISGGEIRGGLSKGRPGRWRVIWKIISAVDGHTTRGRVKFMVKGQRDCSAGPTAAAPPPAAVDETEFPWLRFTAASVAVIGVAAIARAATSPRRRRHLS